MEKLLKCVQQNKKQLETVKKKDEGYCNILKEKCLPSILKEKVAKTTDLNVVDFVPPQ